MRLSFRFRLCLALGLAGSLSLATLSTLPSVRAQSSGLMSVQEADGLLVNIDTTDLATDLSLDDPEKPRKDRGIICEFGQPASECDDRVPMLDRGHPWSAIGRIVLEDTDGTIVAQCTGTLVTDDIVLTNAHCVVDPETHEPYNERLIFEPNLINGVLADRDDRAQIIDGVYGTDFSDRAEFPHPNDWAIVKLDRPVGRKYGSIPLKALPWEVFSNNPDKFTLVGYSFDFPDPQIFTNLQGGKGKTPSVHEQCSVVGESDDGVLIHDCDMRGGASGGPIVTWINGEPYIVAVNSAEWANQVTGIGLENYATNVARPIEWIQQQQ